LVVEMIDREVPEPPARLLEEVARLVRVPLAEEHGAVQLDSSVDGTCSILESVEREMLAEVRHAAQGQWFVGAPDPELERHAVRGRRLDQEEGHPAAIELEALGGFGAHRALGKAISGGPRRRQPRRSAGTLSASASSQPGKVATSW